ncbi:MAG: hypothetical protein AB1733_22100 [Thermodesulfobacteriota bacterium]
MEPGRRLHIPRDIPEDFADAVATVLLLGLAAREVWDQIYQYPVDTSLAWIQEILAANDSSDLVHADLEWWERQLRGH